jgi:hypothetical protein
MEHGIGTTHFSLSLANYLCSSYRKRTAYVELNGSGQICLIAKNADAYRFSYMDIVCYPSAVSEDLSRILSEHFSYIILDLGVLTFETGRDFYRCDLKFIIGSVSPWKAGRYYEALESLLYNTNMGQDHIVILGNLGTKEAISLFRRFYHLPVCAIPVIQNPFQLTTANCTFFQKMLANHGIYIPQ